MTRARLTLATLRDLPPGVARPAYDPRQVGVGVVHIGPGAFHRVHQADYLDRLLATDPRWGVAEVSLRSSSLRDALAPQDGLYTLAELEQGAKYRVIGALREMWVASENAARLLERLQDPALRTVTLTVTEKGYCLAPDGGLDHAHPDIQRDLLNLRSPSSAPGLLAALLAQRKESGQTPPVILSCDNLADNGRRLRRAVVDFARAFDADLARWIEAEVAFPCTMVDSITPATTPELRDAVGEALGVEDAWPVQRETFTQWVIEADPRLAAGPDWNAAGAVVTTDVAGFEQAKLRLLNGAHSTLAYVGILRGHQTVREAMEDRELGGFVECLMRSSIKPQVRCPTGFDADAYITAVLSRFRNPSLRHELAQIAWDGSQKLPFRILGTVEDALRAGAPVDALAVPVAAWMRFLVRRQQEQAAVVDPMAPQLLPLIAATLQAGGDVVGALLGVEKVFPAAVREAASFTQAVRQAYGALPNFPA